MAEKIIFHYVDENKNMLVLSFKNELVYATQKIQDLMRTLSVKNALDVLPQEHTVLLRRILKELRYNSQRATLTFEETHKKNRIIRYVYSVVMGSVLVECTDVTEQRSKEESLKEKALYDTATGLKNQTAFQDDIQTEIFISSTTAGSGFGLAFIDLNDFKKINDTHGHLFGDTYLRYFAQGLLARTGTPHSVYRYGGDEFIILLRNVKTYEKMRMEMEKIHPLFSEFHTIQGIQVSYAASAGCALYKSGMTVDELVHACDMAMYESKKRKKDESFPYTITSHITTT